MESKYLIATYHHTIQFTTLCIIMPNELHFLAEAIKQLTLLVVEECAFETSLSNELHVNPN